MQLTQAIVSVAILYRDILVEAQYWTCAYSIDNAIVICVHNGGSYEKVFFKRSVDREFVDDVRGIASDGSAGRCRCPLSE